MTDRQVMLDTNTVSYLLRENDSKIKERLVKTGMANVCVSVVTEAELRFGCLQRPAATNLTALVTEFISAVDSLPWNSESAKSYAELRMHCKKKGLALGCMDMLIAAHSMAVDARLISSDKAFSHLSDLLTLDSWYDG
ncbi:MAG: type II toxin-antitoxin system VapC family toxin [Granulosicoccus sp.]